MKPRKAKPFNPAKAKRKLDRMWSEYVRRRDGKCMFCGKTGRLEANHILSRAHMATRWNIANGIALCFRCHHIGFHHDPVSGAEKVREIIGENLYRELYALAHTVKPFDLVSYECTLVELQRKLKEVNNEGML